MKFKDFITEKYLEGSKAPLYHWTGEYNLGSILRTQTLGYPAEDGGYEPMKGVVKFKKGWVSFTRDKNYRVHGDQNTNLRFSFDPIKLQQYGHKIKPRVDRFVVSNALDHDSTLPQHEARFEAEEIVMGPIPFKHGLIAIEADPKIIKNYKRLIEIWTKEKEKNLKTAEDVRNGMKFTVKFFKDEKGPNYSDKLHGKIVKEFETELEKDPNWKPKWFTPERYEKFAKNNQELIDQYTKFLATVKEIK